MNVAWTTDEPSNSYEKLNTYSKASNYILAKDLQSNYLELQKVGKDFKMLLKSSAAFGNKGQPASAILSIFKQFPSLKSNMAHILMLDDGSQKREEFSGNERPCNKYTCSS